WSSPAEASSDCPLAVVPNATELTPSLWPVRGLPMGAPVMGSHSRTVPSQLAEASSGSPLADMPHATELTPSLWPLRGLPMGPALLGSHSRRVWSSSAEASSDCPLAVVPNATEFTGPLWPVRAGRLSSVSPALMRSYVRSLMLLLNAAAVLISVRLAS